MTLTIRQMAEADVVGESQVQVAAFEDFDRRHGIDVHPITSDAGWERIYGRHRHFLQHDPGGSWVALDGDRIIGAALALRRESLWGLSLLVVDPATQSAGAGRRLMDASLTYAEGCQTAVIMSSIDPRAIRTYATSGFGLFPQVEAVGTPEPASLPAASPRIRVGSTADVEVADAIDRAARGAPHGPDHVRMTRDQSELTLFVVDDADGRGYAYVRSDGELYCLAATNESTASTLLWQAFAHASELDKPANVPNIDANQQWAIDACFAARLKVTPAGPVFWRGTTPPPAYLPSGAYL